MAIEFEFRATSQDDPEWAVIHRSGGICLSSLLSNFEQFLRGCGFSFVGKVEIVAEEVINDEEV